jgi:hypothetical protein
MSEYLWKSIRPSVHGGVDVIGFKVMPESSVLAGQTIACFINAYINEELALRDYPDAQGTTSEWIVPPVSVNHLPSEDDPVAGGMFPDDC